MSDNVERQGEVLYAPQRRLSRQGRRSVGGLLCRALGIVALLAGLWVAYKAGQGLVAMKGFLDFQHQDIVYKEPSASHASVSGAKDVPLVQPLLRSNESFSIRATVWLDVTQHLEQNHTLPLKPDGQPLQLVSYNVGRYVNRTRTEVVVFSDIVMNLTSWHERKFATLPLQIPIDPFYTQDLGPSTLRLTTHVEVPKEKEEALGKLVNARSVFRRSTAFLPRSPRSLRIKNGLDSGFHIEDFDAETLSDVLELNGASSSLLAAIASDKHMSKCPDGGPNLVEEFPHQAVPSFLDNVFKNRFFTYATLNDDSGHRLILHGENCTVFAPHILSRSSVVLVTADYAMEYGRYLMRQTEIKTDREWKRCFDDVSETLPASCSSSMRRHVALETLAEFETVSLNASTDGENQKTKNATSFNYRYGPTLSQRFGSAGPRDHHTIPRRRPRNGKSLLDTRSLNKPEDRRRKERCILPILEPDISDNFFSVDLQLRFGSMKGFRASLLDMHGSKGLNTTVIKDDDELDHLRFYTDPVAETDWALAGAMLGERVNEAHSPISQLVNVFVEAINELIVVILTLGYWYTITTTAGLCMWAQWAGTAGNVVDIWLGVRDAPTDASIGTFFYHLPNLVALLCALLRTSVLARIEIVPPKTTQSWLSTRVTRRPQTKTERRCAIVERNTFGWRKIVMILTALSLYEYLVMPQQRSLRSGVGCYDDGAVDAESRWHATLLFADVVLARAYFLGQTAFNAISPAIDANRRGSFAGSFKITAILLFASKILSDLASHVERIGGQVIQRVPVSMMHVEVRIVLAIQAVQAILYPGIPVKIADEEDEEDL